jgi:hypothetical protein
LIVRTVGGTFSGGRVVEVVVGAGNVLGAVGTGSSALGIVEGGAAIVDSVAVSTSRTTP